MAHPQTRNTRTKSARRSSASSFISNRNKHTYKRTPAAAKAALEKRELLEGINLYGDTYHAARCFPYHLGLPMPDAARARAAQGITRRSCNSRHDCPVCTSKYMAEKREDFIRLMDSWVADGGLVHSMTLTIRNSFLEPSRAKYEALSRTWTAMNRRRPFQSLKSEFGAESVRVLEEVLTDEGWFPHYHLVWFFPSGVTRAQVKTFMAKAKTYWCEAANSAWKLGADLAPQFDKPVTLSRSKSFAQYLFKHGFHNLDFDPEKDELSPFKLVRDLLATGEAHGWQYWQDFTHASEGMNRVRFSKGLNGHLSRALISGQG